jgi:ring-1,2-phenylacetyl-CoA epoxidase subunit PaaB
MSSTSDPRHDQPAGQPWEVFVRARRGLVHQHVGTVRASDARAAVRSAAAAFGGTGEAGSIWVVPTGQITTSRPEQRDAFFGPAADKAYRHATYYVIPAEVQHL